MFLSLFQTFNPKHIILKGAWEDPFEKELTEEKDFHVNKNKVIKVPMMYRLGRYSYLESDELKSQVSIKLFDIMFSTLSIILIVAVSLSSRV